MSPETLTSYLHRNIPLTAAMKLSAITATPERVTLRCPLEPNVNHHQTAFGGSLSAAMMLTGWAMMRVRMGSSGLLDGAGLELDAAEAVVHSAVPTPVRLVVSKSATDFLTPVTEDFTTECRYNDELRWSRFVERFVANDWAKLHLQAAVVDQGRTLARMKATFVAIRGGGPSAHLADE